MQRNLFLYLALACFVGIIAIFIADGYMGIYDTIYVTAGEHEQTIAPDHWYRYRYNPSVGAEWGEKVFFRYEIDNRQFSTYSAAIQASVWKENEKVIDLFSEQKSIKPFDKVMVEWVLSAQELEKAGFGADTYTRYTVKISHGEVERRIVVNFHYPEGPVPPKVAPVPPPR